MRNAFNHIYAAELTTRRQPAGSKTRRAHVIAGDDAHAKAVVTNLLDEFRVDTLDAGRLREGWRTQRDTPGYGPRRTAEELRKDGVGPAIRRTVIHGRTNEGTSL